MRRVKDMEIKADLHTHTVASGHAYSTLTENALEASRKGIELLGMTDHGPMMPGAPVLYHFGNLVAIPEVIYGVRILRGAEANITNHEGELDIPPYYIRRLELVLVGLHEICYPGGTVEQNTVSYIKAMENPMTDMMVHPGRAYFEMDLERIAYMSAQLNVPVEINNSSLHKENKKTRENCFRFAGYAARYKGPVFLGSDAHFWDQVGDFSNAMEIVQEAGIGVEQIINISAQRVLVYLEERRGKRPAAAKEGPG